MKATALDFRGEDFKLIPPTLHLRWSPAQFLDKKKTNNFKINPAKKNLVYHFH